MSDTPTAKVIRQYCDGELPREQTEEIEAHLRDHPEQEAWVAFERNLHDHVGSVMRADCPGAPPELRERVSTRIAEAAARDAADGEPLEGGAIAAWWRGPMRANVFAVAACLALVAGAVLFGIFGRPIDSWQRPGLIDAVSEAAAAVASEHVTATTDPAAIEGKLAYHTPDRAARELAGLLRPAAGVFDLSDVGYEFYGGNMCDVPHCPEGGCHLIYRRAGERAGLVTLHIVPDLGQFALEGEGTAFDLPLAYDLIAEGPTCQKDVVVWTHADRAYLLVVCLAEDVEKVARRVQKALITAPAKR